MLHTYTNTCRNKDGICIPNSTTDLWTVDDVGLLDFLQCDQRVSSSDTLHQDLI